MMDNLGQYAVGAFEWRRLLAAAPEENKAKIFANACTEFASYVSRGLDKTTAADALHELASTHRFGQDEDYVQSIISDAFDSIEMVPDAIIDLERERELRKGNGHAPDAPLPKEHHATPYIYPDPTTLPCRRFLYGLHYVRGIVSATVAPGGFGKTTLALYEALIMVGTGLRVWYISAEDDKDEINRRIAAHLQEHDVRPMDIRGRLFIDDKDTFPLKIAKIERNGEIKFDAQLDVFEKEIVREKIDVVILDPFISFHALSENDTSAMDALVKKLGGICSRRKCCIELSHHVRKPNIGQFQITVYDARGAGAIVNAVRSCRVINQMTRNDALLSKIPIDQRHFYIRVDSGKRNMAPPEAAKWCQLVNVDIANGDKVQALKPYDYKIRAVTANDADRQWLKVMFDGGQDYRTSTQADNWLGRRVAERLGLDATCVDDIKLINRAITLWKNNGWIKQISLPDDKRKPRPHWVLGDILRKEVDLAVKTDAPDEDNQFDFVAPRKSSFQIVAPSIESCAFCSQRGDVYLIRDPFRGVTSNPLHERCAAAFYGREK